jgi:VanZ family protein
MFMPNNGNLIGHYFDKVIHVIIFFSFSLSFLLSLSNRVSVPNLISICLIFGLLTEFFQQYIPGRYMTLSDIIANILGILGAYIFFKIKKEKIQGNKSFV